MTDIKDPRDLYEMKRRAVEYYSENGVPQKMEEILNSTFYDNPEDVYGHLANFFASHAKTPVISKLKAKQALDSKGQATIQTDVYCTVRNIDKVSGSFVSPSINSQLLDNAKQEDRDIEDRERTESVTSAIDIINSSINEDLSGLDPCDQEGIDDKLCCHFEKLRTEEEERLAREGDDISEAQTFRSDGSKHSTTAKKLKSPKTRGAKSAQIVVVPEEPKEKFLSGSHAVSSVSQAVCCAAAHANSKELFEHIADLRFQESPSEFNMPLPLVTIIQSGKAAPGKLNSVKEFMIVPKPDMPLSQSIKHIGDIYSFVAKSLSAKGGVAARYVNEIGALCPQFDKPEQGLDILQEAITSIGLTHGEDFHIVLNCAGHEMFDYDKGKYEIAGGQVKAADDMVEYWSELVGRYPSILALIDPMRKQEGTQWMMLCEKITENCHVFGDNVYHRPGQLINEQLTEEFKTNGIVLRLEQLTTVTDVLKCSDKMEEAENQIVISGCQGDAAETFLADLAVGMGAKFLKLGSPTRGERVALLNRLLQIEDILLSQDKLGKHGDHKFIQICVPPPPEPAEGDDESEDSKRFLKPDAKKK